MARRHLIPLVAALTILLVSACDDSPPPRTASHATGQFRVADRSTPGVMVTPPPTPTPTPIPTPEPAVQPQPATPTAAPPPPRLRVVGPGVNVAIVGSYTDCTGKGLVGWGGAYFDACFTNTFIMAHPTFFGPMNGWAVGTAVTYYDAAGGAHQLHIISTAVYPPHALLPTAGIGAVTFQVCLENTVDSPIRVLGAAP